MIAMVGHKPLESVQVRGRRKGTLAYGGGLVAVFSQNVAQRPLFGWQPVGGAGSLVDGLVALLLASTAFAGIGLVLAGRLRAEINLAASNGLYIVLLLTSGFIVPLESFPTWMRSVVELLPSGALTSVLHSTSARADVPVGSFIALLAWAVVTPLLAAKTFRFD